MKEMRCFSCGEPLGSETGLCRTCEQEEITLDVVDSGESVTDRVERYFIVSSLRCAECGDLHGTVTLDDETYTADDFAIESVHEWKLEMDKEEEWIQDNERVVRTVLPALETEWPQCVLATKTHLLS